MKNALIIIKKQLKDTIKNKTVFIQVILFPIMTLIMENVVKIDEMPKLYFTRLFSMMYIGMAPISSVAAIISEEKEKNTLRVLIMANIKPWEYILGIGIYVWSICMIGACVMASGLESIQIPFYLLCMAIGFFISVMAGACIGILSKNQMMATSLVMPVIMILSFIPMLGTFNEMIEKISRFIYTQQIGNLLDAMSFKGCSVMDICILIGNAVLAFALFFVSFKKKGLE